MIRIKPTLGERAAARATLVAAEPTRLAFTTRSSGFAGSTRVTRYRYRFSDSSGTLRDGHSYRIGKAIEHDGPTGREIDIEYAASRPSFNRVVGGTLSPVPFVFNTIDIPTALAFLLLIGGVRAGVRRTRLLRGGTLTFARVVSRSRRTLAKPSR